MRGEIKTASRSEFARLRGPVEAPVALTGEMSDYVRVNKGDLLSALRHYEIGWVEYYRDPDGTLRFVAGHEERPS